MGAASQYDNVADHLSLGVQRAGIKAFVDRWRRRLTFNNFDMAMEASQDGNKDYLAQSKLVAKG